VQKTAMFVLPKLFVCFANGEVSFTKVQNFEQSFIALSPHSGTDEQ